VPDPVVERSREVLDRLREEKAIEARGSGGDEPVQTVFDLGSGQFQMDDTAGRTATTDGAGEDSDDPRVSHDEAATDVLEELSALDVSETPPVELLSRVQEWQQKLE
jgi:DNA mismatch repair protein MutS